MRLFRDGTHRLPHLRRSRAKGLGWIADAFIRNIFMEWVTHQVHARGIRREWILLSCLGGSVRVSKAVLNTGNLLEAT
jgi:hypothetical protein